MMSSENKLLLEISVEDIEKHLLHLFEKEVIVANNEKFKEDFVKRESKRVFDVLRTNPKEAKGMFVERAVEGLMGVLSEHFMKKEQ